jgi:hypothetical protein
MSSVDGDDVPVAGDHGGEAEAFGAVADHLAEATLELERLDRNVPTDEELRTILDAKTDLREICLRYRRMDPRAGGGDSGDE